MKLSAFGFSLPSDLIVSEPLSNQEQTRLMVLHRATGRIEHLRISKLSKYFKAGDVMVINNSKVSPARLSGYKERTKAPIELVLLYELDPTTYLWDTSIEPARKIRIGNKLHLGKEGVEIEAEVVDNTTSGGRTIRLIFPGSRETLQEIIAKVGMPAMPREMSPDYAINHMALCQTAFATKPGSITPQSGGLHLSPYFLKYLELQDVALPRITIHNSRHSFKSIETEDLRKYKAVTEYYDIPEKSAGIINTAIKAGKRICAVGLSTLKALESSTSSENLCAPQTGWSNKFFHPPYTPIVPNALLTNFFPPKTPHFVNTAAFGGYKLIMKAYNAAIEHGYRFMLYGDALLII